MKKLTLLFVFLFYGLAVGQTDLFTVGSEVTGNTVLTVGDEGMLLFNYKTAKIEYRRYPSSFDDSDAQIYLIQLPQLVDVYNWLRKNRDYSVLKCIQLTNKWWKDERYKD